MFQLEDSSLSENKTAELWERNSSSTTTTTIIGAISLPEGCVVKQGSDPVDGSSTSLIPKEAEVMARFLLTGICLPLCFVVSFSSNMLNMVVFCKQGLKERINMCLFSLSLLDLLYVAATYGQNSDVLYMFAVGKGDRIGQAEVFYFRNYLIVYVGLGTASQVVSSVVALERCLCVTRPLLVKNLISTKKTALLLWTFLLIIISGVFVSGALRYTIVCVFDTATNTTSFRFYPSQFYRQNPQVIQVLSGVIYGQVLPGLCVTCVTVCTVITATKMKKLSLWRETASASALPVINARDMAVTRMIVGTSVLFIVCIVPPVLVRVCVILTPDLQLGGRYENLYNIFLRIYFLASVINSSFNFFVYYTYGSKFRQTVQEMVLSCMCCKSIPRESKRVDRSSSLSKAKTATAVVSHTSENTLPCR